MSAEKLNISATDEDKDKDICSLQDVIDSEKERNEQASAVLGASDFNNCSYEKGYVYRQALYCCLTCLKQNEGAGDDKDKYLHGVCLACSYECHQNHELCELYTKRNFKCDCGNSKFKNIICKLKPGKDSLNVNNKYNHNFNGLYCVCNRPHPDTSVQNEDDMIQCTICEDWLHVEHLTGKDMYKINFEDQDENDTSSEFDEMICQTCMNKNEFLWNYQGYIPLKTTKSKLSIGSVDVENETEKTNTNSDCFLQKNIEKNEKIDLEMLKDKACFFLSGWREALCKCESCLELYKSKGVEYLTDKKDTIKHYEECGKLNEAQEQQIDENKLLNDQLSKLNRVSQVEFLHNLNDFKQELKDFLADFAVNGKVVKRENILEFFEDLNQRKRRKVN